jgi:predicted DNA-binding mobile mystery protein A
MKPSTVHLKRRQLDRRIKSLFSLRDVRQPSEGWLKAIRESLGMTAAQAGKRAGASQQTWTRSEESEANKSMSITTLEKYAAALGCRVVFALVPNSGSLEDSVLQQARLVAAKIAARTNATMRLENQEVSKEELAQQTEELALELVRNLKSTLWEE